MITIYGLGGWNPESPGENVVERIVDHGDGTATRTFFGPDGQPTGTETLTGLPLAPFPEPTPGLRTSTLRTSPLRSTT